MYSDDIPPPEERLKPEDAFRFHCHHELACFNSCCRNKRLPLTPYDVLRLKNGLHLHSDEFLARHTSYSLDLKTGFPVIYLNMSRDKNRPCPFLTAEGCGVYGDRPTACRLYPLARIAAKRYGLAPREVFYALMETPACLGREEERTWRVEEWLEDQGLSPYLDMNDRMADLVFHPKRDCENAFNEKQVQKIMVAAYNLDFFREFVFKTRFCEIMDVDRAARARIKADDEALLNMGMVYLFNVLYSGGQEGRS